ncbi:MAG: glycoside hydrolase [Thermoplasmata archaeon]|nr:glycoside hydrolase [Thermoplasmata archaeon]
MRSARSFSWRPFFVLLTVCAMLSWGVVGGAQFVAAATTPASGTGLHAHSGGSPRGGSLAPELLTPSSTGGNGTFFQNNSNIAYASFNSSNELSLGCVQFQFGCNTYGYIQESSSPGLLALPNGNVGLAYQVILNTSQSLCNFSANQTISHIAFVNSTDGGAHWGVPQYLGDTNATCPYNQELEPSFATNDTGSALGVYVVAQANLTGFGNASARETCTFSGPFPTCNYTALASPVNGYVNRSSDALVFVNSSDSGVTFSPGRIIEAGANFARPAIADFGHTIYVAYEDINNSTTPLPDGNYPISVQLVYSTDGGTTWSTPVLLPGENASELNTSESPSISVSSTGEVAVAYDTNRSCLANCSVGTIGPLSNFGDDVVVATSTTNNSSWALHTIYHATGEPTQSFYCYYGPCRNTLVKASYIYDDVQDSSTGGQYQEYPFAYYGSALTHLFQYAPPTSVAWNTTGSAIFVAWGGSTNESRYFYDCSAGGFFCIPSNGYSDYGYQGLYVASSANGGVSWSWEQLGYTGGTVGGNPSPCNPFCNQISGDVPLNYYNIGLTVAGGVVYLAYQTANTTVIPQAGSTALCGFPEQPGYTGATVEWLTNSSDGLHWSAPWVVADHSTPYYANVGVMPYIAYGSSVLIRNHQPIVATAMLSFCSQYLTYSYWNGVRYVNQTYCASTDPSDPYDTVFSTIDVATVSAAPRVWLTVQETGLPSGTAWSFGLLGNQYLLSTTSANVSVLNGSAFILTVESPLFSAGSEYLGYAGGGAFNFSANGSVLSVGYVGLEPFNLTFDPSYTPSTLSSISNYTWGFGYGVQSSTACQFTGPATCQWVTSVQGCPMPWLLPAGYALTVADTNAYEPTNLTVASSGPPLTWWAGTGSGNYSGTATNFTVVMNNPINETFWSLPIGYYGVDVEAPGLPSTSHFGFNWDGVAQATAAGGGTDVISNAVTGVHTISNISATSTQTGWVYIGHVPGGDQVIVPLTPVVNLSFAYEDLGTPAGVVAFHAANLTVGTAWQLSVNGTTYSSLTPWINVTTHTGTYDYSVGPAASADGSTGYVAQGSPSTISVTAGDTVAVNYTPAFKLTLLGSRGGTVLPSGVEWLLPGATTLPLTAAPRPGNTFVGWSGTGNGAYNGSDPHPVLTINGPVVETADFAPLPADRFDLNFTESGIPLGASWEVQVGGTPYSTNGSQLVVPHLDRAPAHYLYSVPSVYGANATDPTRYVPVTSSGVVVAGTNLNVSIAFQTQYFLTLESTNGGTVSAQAGNQFPAGSQWFPTGTGVSLYAVPATGELFVGWVGVGPGSYTGPNASQIISPSGSVSELATFAPEAPPPPPTTYTIEFALAQPVAAGTAWSVTLGGSTYGSVGATLNVTGLSAGTLTANIPVAYAPNQLMEYTAQNRSATIHIGPSTGTVWVTFKTAYWVEVIAVGPGTVSAGSTFVTSGVALSVLALPDPGDVLTTWSGTGPGAYTGTLPYANVTAVSGPVVEVASFSSAPPASPAGQASFLQSETGLVLLAGVGLVVGAVLGVLGRRRVRRPPLSEGGESPPEPAESWDETRADAP